MTALRENVGPEVPGFLLPLDLVWLRVQSDREWISAARCLSVSQKLIPVSPPLFLLPAFLCFILWRASTATLLNVS